MPPPGGESDGEARVTSEGHSTPDRSRTSHDAGSSTPETKQGNSFHAWLSRGLGLGMGDERETRRRIEAEIQASIEVHETDKERLRGTAAKLSADVIRRHEEAAAQRLRAIEDKARANLLSITIGVAVLFAGLDLLEGGGLGVKLPVLQVLVPLCFVAAVLYFLLGGLMAIKALEVARVFVPRLEEEAERNEIERSMQALWNLEQNEKTIFLRTNALSSSSYGLRNGVFCLAVLVILLAASIVVTNVGSPTDTSSDGLAPSGTGDSVGSAVPAAPASNHQIPSAEVEKDPRAVVGDSIAVPDAVDTISDQSHLEDAAPDEADAIFVNHPRIATNTRVSRVNRGHVPTPPVRRRESFRA